MDETFLKECLQDLSTAARLSGISTDGSLCFYERNGTAKALGLALNWLIQKRIGCPVYNPGFCYPDDDCVACWDEYMEENNAAF